jgi:hypothetical protein
MHLISISSAKELDIQLKMKYREVAVRECTFEKEDAFTKIDF